MTMGPLYLISQSWGSIEEVKWNNKAPTR